MGRFKKYIIRIVAIFVSILLGYLITSQIVQPYMLSHSCYLDTGTCIRMDYYAISGSALFNLQPSGLWVWYNGGIAYIYGTNHANKCQNRQMYEPAMVLQCGSNTGIVKGYECIRNLQGTLAFYRQRTSELHLYKNVNDVETFTIWDALNLLHENKIINLRKALGGEYLCEDVENSIPGTLVIDHRLKDGTLKKYISVTLDTDPYSTSDLYGYSFIRNADIPAQLEQMRTEIVRLYPDEYDDPQKISVRPGYCEDFAEFCLQNYSDNTIFLDPACCKDDETPEQCQERDDSKCIGIVTDELIKDRIGLAAAQICSKTCKTCIGEEQCPAGDYCIRGYQTVCPARYYCPKGSFTPLPCPTGTMSGEGAISKSDCKGEPIMCFAQDNNKCITPIAKGEPVQMRDCKFDSSQAWVYLVTNQLRSRNSDFADQCIVAGEVDGIAVPILDTCTEQTVVENFAESRWLLGTDYGFRQQEIDEVDASIFYSMLASDNNNIVIKPNPLAFKQNLKSNEQWFITQC